MGSKEKLKQYKKDFYKKWKSFIAHESCTFSTNQIIVCKNLKNKFIFLDESIGEYVKVTCPGELYDLLLSIDNNSIRRIR